MFLARVIPRFPTRQWFAQAVSQGFSVLNSSGTSFAVSRSVLNSAGTPFAVLPAVLNSSGTSFNPI